MGRTLRIIKLYNENKYNLLINIYLRVENKLSLLNITWIILKNDNRKFVNYLFKKNKNMFSLKQLGIIKKSKFVNLKYIIDLAKKRISLE